MKHRDHTHETAAEARACEARATAGATAEITREAINGRLLRQHENSAIMANLTGRTYRPQSPQQARRDDAKYARKNRVSAPQRREAAPAVSPSTPAFVARPAHPNRVKFAEKLIEEKDTTALDVREGEIMMDVMDGKPVSADEIATLINKLLGCSRKAAAGTPKAAYADQVRALKAQVPDGRYAANIAGSKVRFFLIKEAKGYVKISEYASDVLYPRTWGEYAPILAQIIEDGVEAAGRRFGDEMDMCRKCGRDLTDTDNPYKVYGYGPDCGPRAMG